MNKRFIFFSNIIIFQLIFLSGVIACHLSNIKTASKILLETVPVDPFSVFRGKFIALNYKISRIRKDLFYDMDPTQVKSNDVVYVVLKKKEQFWEAEAVLKERPQDPSVIYLTGKVSYPSTRDVSVEYGIESFFLSEASADEIENQRFPRTNWQERERRKNERIAKLSEEDKRIYHSQISQWWYGKLNQELDVWTQEGLIQEDFPTKIREKYTQALERIKKAETGEANNESVPAHPLTVEVAVTQKGIGYPLRLFWEGKEYR